MRQIIYSCDYCQNTLSSEQPGKGTPHLSIDFGRSGYVAPIKGNPGIWGFGVQWNGIFQFCDVKCLTAWVKDKLRVHKTVNYRAG